MKTTKYKRALTKAAFCLLAIALFSHTGRPLAQAQIISRHFPPGGMPSGNGNESPPPGGDSSGGKHSGGGPWIPSEPLTPPDASDHSTNEIQLSFQGASVDMVAQWLAQTTGKTVIKDPQVQCQITIMSSKKMPPREAINMIYRALGIQGYSVEELSDSIIIVPQGKEPNMSPEVVTSTTNLPPGRQLLVKVFQLKHAQAADVKDRIQTALSDKATVEVDESANQIIVTDYNDNLRVVGDLIDALDSEHPQDVAVRVIPLKHIAADQLAKEIAPLYDKMNSQNKTAVNVAADDRSNSLIIFSDLSEFGAIEKLAAMMDTEEAQEKVTRTFILKNADAEDVAKQLQDLTQSQETTARYAYYFSEQPNNPRTVSIVADRRRNAVIVQAPPARMESLENMINELDAPVADTSLEPEIISLKYANASDVEDVLDSLFLKKNPQRSYWDIFFGDDNSDDNSGDQNDAGRLYGKVRITSDPYSNAIIVTANSRENLEVIENVVEQLDQPSQAGESTLRIGLKYAKADTIANSLNILFAKNGSPALHATPQQDQNNNQQGQQQQQQSQQTGEADQTGFSIEQESKVEGYYPWLGGQPDNLRSSDQRDVSQTVSDLVGRVRCVADQRGNAVLVSANVHFFPQILQLIQTLDAPSDKVTIEARIIQVSSDYLDKLGVRWSPNGSAVFSTEDYDDSILASGSGNYQLGIGPNTTVNTPNSTSVGTVVQTLASLRSGVVSSTLNIDYLVQFMREKTDATVLGEPSITIDDNETGKLFVGQEVPIPGNTLVSSVGTQNTSITYKNDVGVTLEVTPHINSDGDVQLMIHVESSTIDSSGPVLGGDVFDTDNFRTEATAKNNETLLLGGIIQKQYSNIIRKFPILGDVPGLGWAFKKKDKTTQDVELMVFLRPVVIHTPLDARRLQEEFNQQTPLLQQWRDQSK